MKKIIYKMTVELDKNNKFDIDDMELSDIIEDSI
jgi:hypothetical protein